MFQVTAPVPPTEGAVAGAGLAETKVVLGGVASLITTDVAADAPVLL